MIRISHLTLFNRTGSQITENYDRYVKQQALVSVGKSFLKASDAPADAAQALQARQLIGNNEQFQKNIQTAHGWVTYTDQQLNAVMTTLQDARQTVVQLSNDVTFEPGSPERMAAAEKIDAMLEEMMGYANEQYEGRYIFGGFQTDQPPFTPVRNAQGEITSVTYTGNQTVVEDIQREVSDSTRLTINVDGKEVFVDPSGTSTNEKVFNQLIKLRDDIRSAKPLAPPDGTVPPYNYPTIDYLTQHLTALDNTMDRMDLQRAELGERGKGLTRLLDQTRNQHSNLSQILSSREDLDMAQGALQLTNQLNLYQAAINAGAKIVSPTLMQFLK